MKYQVGDSIYNRITGEHGKILRIVDANTYVVLVATREALWRKTHITRNPDELDLLLRWKWARYETPSDQ